jgi:Trk-type K+ transport system membrane component
MVKDFMNFENLSSTKSLLREILFLAFSIELAGTAIIYLSWGEMEFENFGKKIFYSSFHSVSAFNNAGFSIFTDGYFNGAVRTNFGLHIITAVLILCGSIGFPAFIDLFGRNNLKQRILFPWKKLKVSTRLATYSTFLLILLGAIVFYWAESKNYNHFVEGGFIEQNTIEKIVTSFFQSITRTAGFNTVDFGVLSTTTLFVFIFLMFVGASPGSTGGGIKTTTFSVLLLSAISTIRGKKNIELWKKTIPNEIVRKALAILFFSLFFVFTGTLILTVTDPEIDFIRLFFEEVSAFSTVGLSTGITAQLSIGGKIVIMSSMFIGRIGILTLAFALGKKAISNSYKYPDTYIMVG